MRDRSRQQGTCAEGLHVTGVEATSGVRHSRGHSCIRAWGRPRTSHRMLCRQVRYVAVALLVVAEVVRPLPTAHCDPVREALFVKVGQARRTGCFIQSTAESQLPNN